MILFLYNDFKKLLHELLSLIVKVDIMEIIKIICDIDLVNKENFLPIKAANVSFGAEGTSN